ncbi:NUDIX hydrolase [Lentzea sp. PSKA42]|uniref:NUDIX hydrolase n=1 Tax=Lentzea indica TaxID=2604800 RepID=A0ABX1FL42_9PSEU|nr:NUDIX domain-containing protein [Lentzea indica]NKE59706.1 NUDIX hydrolase [Lentzea indica]
MPGGYVDIDESLAAARRRELSEELGLNRAPSRLIAVDWAPVTMTKQGSGARPRKDHDMSEEATIVMLLAQGPEVTPVWREIRGSRDLTFEPTLAVEEYPSSILPQVGEHIVIEKPVRVEGPVHAQVAAVIHHWTMGTGPVAFVILRGYDANAPIRVCNTTPPNSLQQTKSLDELTAALERVAMHLGDR